MAKSRKNRMLTLIVLLAAVIFAATLEVCFAQDSWVWKSSMQQSRSGLGLTVVNGKIFAIGGFTSSGPCALNEAYDPATNNWTYKTPMPTPRTLFAIATFNGKIYCIGGYNPSDSSSFTVNEVYDVTSDTWQTKAPMPIKGEGTVQANVVNDKIYVMGINPNGIFNLLYDPTTDSWTTKTPVTTPGTLSFFVSAVIEGKIYVFSSGFTRIYDVQNDSWSRGTPSPLQIAFQAAGATTGMFAPARIYIFGLESIQPLWPLQTNEFKVQSYDPKNDSWVVCNSMANGRYDASVAGIDDLLYVVGGVTTVFRSEKFDLNFIYIYSPYNQQYTPIGYGTVPPTISINSPLNAANYTSGNVSLAYSTNKPLTWQGYSVDRQDIVTLTGNTTISGLSNGQHNLTVYVTDSFGNNASQTVTFKVNLSQVPQATIIAMGSGASVAVVVAGLLVYIKKYMRKLV